MLKREFSILVLVLRGWKADMQGGSRETNLRGRDFVSLLVAGWPRRRRQETVKERSENSKPNGFRRWRELTWQRSIASCRMT